MQRHVHGAAVFTKFVRFERPPRRSVSIIALAAKRQLVTDKIGSQSGAYRRWPSVLLRFSGVSVVVKKGAVYGMPFAHPLMNA